MPFQLGMSGRITRDEQSKQASAIAATADPSGPTATFPADESFNDGGEAVPPPVGELLDFFLAGYSRLGHDSQGAEIVPFTVAWDGIDRIRQVWPESAPSIERFLRRQGLH